MYCVYRILGPSVAFLWYLGVVLLSVKGVNVLWMIWTAPFFFALPLGAAENSTDDPTTPTNKTLD